MSRNPRGRRSQLNIINKKVLLIVGIAIIALLCIFLMIKFMVAKKHNKDETSTNPNLEILFEEINKEADKLKKQEDTNINIEKVMRTNCSAMLYPFIRERIARITQESLYRKPYYLESINFIAVYNDWIERTSQQG